MYAEHFATGDIYITVENAKVTTTGGPSSGNSPIPSVGVYGWHYGGGNTDISLTNTTVSTMGDLSHGIWVRVWDPDQGNTPQAASDVRISATGGSITTNGKQAHGVYGYMSPSTDTLEIELNNVDIKTESTEDYSNGLTLATGAYGLHEGTGNLDIDARGGSIATKGSFSYGIYARHHGSGDAVTVRTQDGHSISTMGPSGHGIVGYHLGTHDTRSIDITVGGSVTTEAARARKGFV